MKSKVAAGAQPWKAGWDVLVANPNSSLTRAFTNPVPAIIYRGFDGTNPENYASIFRDAAAAYQTALRWKISGDDAYANKSIAILNAWAAGMKTISGTSDKFLLAGIQGYQLANAAEIMRSYSGWAPADFSRFQNWMLTIWYSMNHDFLVNHNGACISNYYANWDLCNMASMLSIGVLCDRRDIYNEAVDYFKNGAGMGSIRNVVPYVYGDLGQWQESGRDQGHTVLGVALAGSFCEMAWNQGDDLYGYDDNRLLKGFEYIAKYNLGYDVPFTTYSNCIGVVQTIVSEDGRGNIRPVWELVYNHYVNRKGLSAPYTARFAQIVRPEGGGGNYDPNSGGYDQLGFGTLTASLDEAARPNTQTITFPAIPNKDYGTADFSPGATASSGLPVAYSSSNPVVASINADGTIHVSKPGTTTLIAQQMGNSQYTLAPIVYQTLTVNQIPGVTDGTWTNTAGIVTTTLSSTAGSANLIWPGQTFVVGDLVRLTSTVPGGFVVNTNYSVVAVNGAMIQLALRPGGTAIAATTSIANGTASRFLKWSTAANWSNSVIPSGPQSNASFGATSFTNIGGVTLDGNITIGMLTYAANGTSELTLASGLNGGTLTFQTLSGTPTINMINTGARKLFLGNANNNSRAPLKFAGTQGLKIITPVYGGSTSYAGLRIQAAMDWSGLQGTISLTQGTIELHNTTNSLTDANNVLLPPNRLVMGTDATAVLLYNGANLYANKQTVGALDGTSNAYIIARNTLTNGAATLAIGADNQDGSFDGTIGSGPTTDPLDKGRVNLEKLGTGTQTVTGTIKNGTTLIGGTPFYSSVTVNNGKLVLSGVNEYQGVTTVTSGTLVINGSLASPLSVTGGTLTGAGRTSASVLIGNNASIEPGDGPGSFTTTGGLSLSAGATYQLEMSTSEAKADKLVANGMIIDGANLVIRMVGNASSLPVGTSFVIGDNTSDAPVVGIFNGLAEGSFIDAGGNRFQLTYQGGSGNDIALLVTKPLQTVKIKSMDGDNGQTTGNQIHLNLTLTNEGTSPVPYNELTVRYWFTPENFAGINAWIDWAQVDYSNVQIKYVGLDQPRNGALGYIEYSFASGAGDLVAGGNSGPIRSRFANTNWADLTQTDDYSYKAQSDYSDNDHVTLYRNGQLIWGSEPQTVTTRQAVKVYTQNQNSYPYTNVISTYITLANDGNVPLNYDDISVRYWFSTEGNVAMNFWIDWAQLGASNLTGQVIQNQNRQGTNAYVELKAQPGLGQLPPMANTGDIRFRTAKVDWTAFDETNDFSYKPAGTYTENNHVTVYYKGQLIYGTEPASLLGGRVAAYQTDSPLTLVPLGNPVAGNEASVVVRGTHGQRVRLTLTDLNGKTIFDQHIDSLSIDQQQRIPMDYSSGIYLLQAATVAEQTTIKLIKP